MPLTKTKNFREKSYYDGDLEDKAKEVHRKIMDIQSANHVSFAEAVTIYKLVLKEDAQLARYHDQVYNDTNFSKLLKKLNLISKNLTSIHEELQEK